MPVYMRQIFRSTFQYLFVIFIFLGCVSATQITDKITQHQLKDLTPSERISKRFQFVSETFPPQQITLIGIKDKQILELWVQNEKSEWQLIHTYPILAASGKLGPKLNEGDFQVPEGLYKILWLNPNSKYHLSLKINCLA